MREVARLLNDMTRDGMIKAYAVFGAMAQMRYTEAVATLDADILVSLDEQDPLALLAPVYRYCRERGYKPEGEAIRVGDWPVQFIPVYDELTADALRDAETADLDGEALRVIRADYLALIALKTGRIKDHLRIHALVEAGAVTLPGLEKMSLKYGLQSACQDFRRRFA
jgi:hypothetical protein